MVGHRNFKVLRDNIGPERSATAKSRAWEMMAEMLLIELQKLGGDNLTELARKLGIQQPAVSQLEQQEDMQVSTLQRIVKAFGGDLEITVRLNGGEYRLAQLGRVAFKNP